MQLLLDRHKTALLYSNKQANTPGERSTTRPPGAVSVNLVVYDSLHVRYQRNRLSGYQIRFKLH